MILGGCPRIAESQWRSNAYASKILPGIIEKSNWEKLGTLPVLIYIFLFRPFCPSRVFAIIQQKSFSKIREVSLYFPYLYRCNNNSRFAQPCSCCGSQKTAPSEQLLRCCQSLRKSHKLRNNIKTPAKWPAFLYLSPSEPVVKGGRFIYLFCSVSLVHKIPLALRFSSRSHPQTWNCQSTVPVVAIDELG